MLAGLVKSPSRLAPSRNPDGAERRAQVVLAAMAEHGFVTETMAQDRARAARARASKPAGAGSVNYVADWIMDVLDDLVGRVEQDLVVETSIDPALQAAAEKALVDELAPRARSSASRRAPGRDDAGRRGARHGRRQELCREPVQPRGRGQAPARLGLQAVRLSHRARARADAGHRARGQADRRSRAGGRRTTAANITAR